MDDRIYSIWFSNAIRNSKKHIKIIFEKFFTAKNIYQAEDFSFVDGLNDETKSRLLDKSLDESFDILYNCVNGNIGVLSYGDPLYPERLRVLSAPPSALYYKGTPIDMGGRSVVAVVGTRNATKYGRMMSYRISKELALNGVIIASGIAAGIDAAAHSGALDAKGYTLAFLGTPINKIYPPENVEIYDRMIKNGVIFSEYYPYCVTNAKMFPIRNRLIAGVSNATLVVEAGDGSGALITAHDAIKQGKSVFAVPGEASGKTSIGVNTLLKQGAFCTTDAKDIILHMGVFQNQKKTFITPKQPKPQQNLSELQKDEAQVLIAPQKEMPAAKKPESAIKSTEKATA
ncbi:MAG: DNA-processing protein DprA, partial [Clostridia bacterium]